MREDETASSIEDEIAREARSAQHEEEEQAHKRDEDRDEDLELEQDLDREIAAEHVIEEKELWPNHAGEEEAMLEEEAMMEQQLQCDFESQLCVDTDSMETSMAAVEAGSARRKSRVSRMRAECAAWGNASAVPEDDDDEGDDQAQALEQELAAAAANTTMLKDWGAGAMDVNAELDWELAQDLDDEADDTPKGMKKGIVGTCDPQCDNEEY